jgi:hypothetical protein
MIKVGTSTPGISALKSVSFAVRLRSTVALKEHWSAMFATRCLTPGEVSGPEIFDVFLCHNSEDKPTVRSVTLKEAKSPLDLNSGAATGKS